MKRFDIYTTTGGTYSTKPRPAVIIQALAFDDFDSLTVIPMTTIKKSGLGEYIGHTENKYIDKIENALLKFIGIK